MVIHVRFTPSTDIQELGKLWTINVYPNPANQTVYIDFEDNEILGSKVIITDVLGKIQNQFVLKDKKNSVDISRYPSGVYFIRFTNGEVLKIIKQ
jgi:hypothetical protein